MGEGDHHFPGCQNPGLITAADTEFSGGADQNLQIMMGMGDKVPVMSPTDPKILGMLFIQQHINPP